MSYFLIVSRLFCHSCIREKEPNKNDRKGLSWDMEILAYWPASGPVFFSLSLVNRCDWMIDEAGMGFYSHTQQTPYPWAHPPPTTPPRLRHCKWWKQVPSICVSGVPLRALHRSLANWTTVNRLRTGERRRNYHYLLLLSLTCFCLHISSRSHFAWKIRWNIYHRFLMYRKRSSQWPTVGWKLGF